MNQNTAMSRIKVLTESVNNQPQNVTIKNDTSEKDPFNDDLPDLSSIQNKNNGLVDDPPAKKVQQKEVSVVPEVKDVVPVDDPIAKRKLILKIQQYIVQFSKYLPQELNIKEFKDFTIEQLQSLLDEIKFTIAVRNSGKMNQRMILQGITLLESLLIAFTPLKVKGLSQICLDKDFQETVLELCLEMEMMYLDPKYRLCYALVSAATTLHIMNSRAEAIQQSEIKTNVDLSKPNDEIGKLNITVFDSENNNDVKKK